MRLLLVSGLVLVPAVALAQSAPPPDGGSGGGAAEDPAPYAGPSGQASAPAPYPPPQPYTPPQPYPPQGNYPPQGTYAPQGYGPPQGPQGYYQQPPPPPRVGRALRNGGTFEVGLGVGAVSAAYDGNSETSDAGALFSIGGGGWLSPDVALTGRISVIGIEQDDVSFSHAVVSINLQRYLSDMFWVGGGIGVASVAVNSGSGSDDSLQGFGLDFRAGINFSNTSEHVFGAHVEVFPGFYEESGLDFRYTGIGIGVGYQHL